MNSSFLEDRRRALEEAFFTKKNQELLKKMQAELAKETTIEQLKAASCLSDERLLQSLVDHGISAESLAALSLVPLVLVAWADGRLEDRERQAILSAANEAGITQTAPAFSLLTNWLEHEPEADLKDLWSSYIAALQKSLDAQAREKLQHAVLGCAHRVATAAGGLLGIGSISPAETKVLEELKQAFES